jgi:hypothetical protein
MNSEDNHYKTTEYFSQFPVRPRAFDTTTYHWALNIGKGFIVLHLYDKIDASEALEERLCVRVCSKYGPA